MTGLDRETVTVGDLMAMHPVKAVNKLAATVLDVLEPKSDLVPTVVDGALVVVELAAVGLSKARKFWRTAGNGGGGAEHLGEDGL